MLRALKDFFKIQKVHIEPMNAEFLLTKTLPIAIFLISKPFLFEPPKDLQAPRSLEQPLRKTPGRGSDRIFVVNLAWELVVFRELTFLGPR